MIANAATAAPDGVPTVPASLAASATWKSFSIATIATQANIDNTSATNPRRAPSSAAPPTSSRTMISSAVRPIDPRE